MANRVPRLAQRSSLLGRDGECALLDELVAAIRRGESRSLLLWGEAGIGKSALLDYLMGSASGLMVVRAVGVESEMELAYASLHQLCASMLDRLSGLPAPQRQALEIVFGLKSGVPPDRFVVALAALGLFSEAAEERPLLCVVDDAQWLDQASALTLALVARRLLAEPVGIVFAAREQSQALEHVPDLKLRGLRNGDARALLSSVVRFRLDDQVRDRVIAEMRGNPLALLELPRELTAAQLAVGLGLMDAQALPARVEESFMRRLEALSEDTRRLLLVAAAEPIGNPLLLWRAAEHLGIEPGAAAHAENEGLLSIDERVIFRHPLVRSAVYRSSSVEDRRTVHLALAEVTDRGVDPDRRALHLAAAATGPDEEVAAELERSAARAQARGGVAAAAAFLKRSVALTLDPGRRAERCLAAAHAHLQAGAFNEASKLVARAEAGSLDGLGRARVELLRGQIAFVSSTGSEAPELLLKAARQLEPLDIALARETYLDAWAATWFAGQFARAGTLQGVSRAAIAAPQPASAPRVSDLLLDGLSALVIEGRAAAAPKLSQAVSLFAQSELAERLRWGWLATSATWTLWDDESKLLVQQVHLLRDAGLLVHLPIYLQQLGLVAVWRGDFGTAASLIAEGDAVAEATGTRLIRHAAVVLAGFAGAEAEASALIEAEARKASAARQGLGIQTCQWISAVLYNGLGRYDQAVVEAQRASEVGPEMGTRAWARVELIEAATRAGQIRLAAETLARLAEAASVGERDWGLGLLARSRALLSESEEAESCYREAIERLGRTQRRGDLARAHLLYGEWLRRENRKIDARIQLRAAHDQFTSIGMEAFAERARRELVATGERLRKRTVETRDELTAHERQIAQLACDGLSNPEIGARLFLSPRTVEWHLRRVFGKLEIHRRRELADALARSDSELRPA